MSGRRCKWWFRHWFQMFNLSFTFTFYIYIIVIPCTKGSAYTVWTTYIPLSHALHLNRFVHLSSTSQSHKTRFVPQFLGFQLWYHQVKDQYCAQSSHSLEIAVLNSWKRLSGLFCQLYNEEYASPTVFPMNFDFNHFRCSAQFFSFVNCQNITLSINQSIERLYCQYPWLRQGSVYFSIIVS